MQNAVSLPPPPPPNDKDQSSAGRPPPRRPRRTILLGLLAGLVVLAVVINQFKGNETVAPGPVVTASSTPSHATVGGDSSPSPTTAIEEPETNAAVTRVIDGDTIEVRYKGRTIDVRLIGIDTPETVAPGEPIECYGPAASRFTEKSLDGERVLLEFDVERTDRFGRTLAYVWIDEKLFNETLVARGFAQVSTFPPNVKYVDRFVDAQREARHADHGWWGLCEVLSGLTGGDGEDRGNCDSSYPAVCIPRYPPDLDCGDITFTNFQVTGSDPHGFDSDDDGIGCET